MQTIGHIALYILPPVVKISLLIALLVRKASNKSYKKIGIALAICKLLDCIADIIVYCVFFMLLLGFVSAFGA